MVQQVTTWDPNTNNFKIKFIECFLKVVHKICDDILKEQIKVILAPIYDQSLSQMYWFSRLSSKHVSKHFRWVASASALYSLGLTGILLRISQTSTKRKRLLHVLLICRRCGYWNWDLKSGVQRNFICASIKILLIKISSLLTKILSHKDSWSEKPRVHPKTHYHENFLYRIPIPLYINLLVSTYTPFYAKKNSNGKIKKKRKMLLLIVL